uniref:Uncharacterized protein n=1 Tax=viral metagenome TaxID=1070528 RepID=A0A6M3LLA5_9ZZZZ
MKFYCNTCEREIDDSELEEPYGLSGCEPACPHCQGSDFSDCLDTDDGDTLIEHIFDVSQED